MLRVSSGVQYSYDANGNVTGLVGPGGATYPIGGAQRGARVAFIGDSITQWDADNTHGLLGNAWPTYFCLSMNGAVTHAGNFAIGSTNSSHALTVQLPQVLAVSPPVTHCFVATGTNDTDPIGQTQTNVKAICAALVNANIIPIIRNMPPSGTAAISAPAGLAVATSITGGTLPPGAYGYRITTVNGVGETTGNTEVTVNTTGSTSSNTPTWQVAPGGTGYRIYRTSAPGGVTTGLIGYNNNTGGSSRPVCSFTDTGQVATTAIPASNTTGVATVAAARLKITTGNTALNHIAQANGYPFYDAYSFFVDGATGMYQTGMTRDGTHPTDKGFKLLGSDMATKLANVFAPYAPYLAGDNVDPTCLFTNPLFLTNNGSYPAGWGPYNGVAAESIVAGTGGKGNAYQINRLDYTGRYGSTGTIAVGSGFSVGDRIRMSGKITVTGADTNGGQASFYLNWAGVAPTSFLANLGLNSDTPGTQTFVFEGVVPVGCTGVALNTALGYGPVTLKIEDITVQNLTALGIA